MTDGVDQHPHCVLLLDEMTAALPADLAETVLKEVGAYRETGGSVIFISHRLLEINKRLNSETDLRSLLDLIMDTAGAKGTGKWMSQLALDLGVPSTLVTTAVFARGKMLHCAPRWGGG